MKIIISALLILASLAGMAQEAGSIFAHLVLGGNTAIATGTTVADMREDFDTYSSFEGGMRPRVGANGGFDLEYFVRDQISLRSGLRYSQKGLRAKSKGDGFYSYDKYTEKVKLDYLDMPLLFGYHKGNLTFYAGALMAYKVFSNYVEVIEDDGDRDRDVESVEYVFGERLKKAVPGIMLGVHMKVMGGATFGIDMQKTGNVFGDNHDIGNLTFQFSLSMPVQLK